MPTYQVELTTDRGSLERIPFTLDDDRPLGAQLRHVLEELRARGLVMRGGPEDELAVSCNGTTLDPSRPLDVQRVSARYPLVLSMRRRVRPDELRTEPPATPFFARGAYLGGVAGFTGAALAWILTVAWLGELPAFLGSYGALDLTVAATLGGGIGALVLGMEAQGRSGSFATGLVTGLVVGAAGAVAGCLAGGILGGPLGMARSTLGFRLTRLATWGLFGALCGGALGVVAWPRDRRQVMDGLLGGAFSGVVGGCLMLLPGPTDLWQMLSFVLVGSVTGYALVGPGIRRAVGVIELERAGSRAASLLGHRWWVIADNRTTRVADRFVVVARAGVCEVQGTAAGVVVAGLPASEPRRLLHLDRVTMSNAAFTFRRQPVRSL